MPDLLALEFESRRVLGLDAQVSPSGVRLRNCFEWVMPEDLDPEQDIKGAGEWLKGQLVELGAHGRQVVLTFPREVAVVRRIELPKVADEELPDLVKYQAGLKSARPIDQLALDFIPLPVSDEAEARDVLITTVPKKALSDATSIIVSAGLELHCAGLSPISAGEIMLRDSGAEGQDSLLVTRHGPRVEISLFRGSNLVFSHFTQVAGEGESADNQAVIAAVVRSLMGLTGPVQSQDIKDAALVGSAEEFEALSPALEKRLSARVRILDPFGADGVRVDCDIPQKRSAYAALVGSLLAQTGAKAEPINFLAPRRPPVKPDYTRRRLIIGGAVAALLALTVGGGIYLKVQELNKEIANLKREQQDNAKLLEKGAPLVERAALIEEWAADRRLWLDELIALDQELPESERAFLNRVEFTLGTRNTPAKLTLEGYSRDRVDAIDLGESIVKNDQRYDLRDDDQKRDDKDPYHPWKFNAELLLKPDAPPVKITTAKPVSETSTQEAETPEKTDSSETDKPEEETAS